MDNEFKTEHQVTIGVEFGSFVVKLEDKIVKLQIWDTAGQESFRSITRIFYRGAHCVFLTYDITREDTFINVLEWLKEVKQHASSDVVIYLIGNRSDLEEDREVFRDRATEFCQQYHIDRFFETSAKTGNNVEEVFSLAAKELYLQQKEQQKEEDEANSGMASEIKGGDQRGGGVPTQKVQLSKNKAGGKEQEKKQSSCC